MKAEIVVQYQQTSEFLAAAGKELNRKGMGLPSWTGWVTSWVIITIVAFAATRTTPIPGMSRLQHMLTLSGLTAALVGLIRFGSRPGKVPVKAPEKVELRFSELAFEKNTGLSRTRTDWSALKHFLDGDEFYFLLYHNMSAEAVPKSAFASTGDLAAFRALLLSKLSPWQKKGHPVFGKTHPIVWLLLLVAIGFSLWQGRNMVPSTLPTISLQDYERRKQDVVEVWISSEGCFEALIPRSLGRNGGIEERYRVDIPSAQLGDTRLLDRLTDGLPHSAIHDARAR